jgi:hypothetical protein
VQRSKDGGEGTAPGDDEDGELTKAAEEHRHRRMNDLQRRPSSLLPCPRGNKTSTQGGRQGGWRVRLTPIHYCIISVTKCVYWLKDT